MERYLGFATDADVTKSTPMVSLDIKAATFKGAKGKYERICQVKGMMTMGLIRIPLQLTEDGVDKFTVEFHRQYMIGGELDMQRFVDIVVADGAAASK